MKKRSDIILIVLAIAVAAVVAFVAAVNIAVVSSSDDKIVEAAAATDKNAEYILILGCGVRDDGTPSDMLRDRLLRGIELYNEGAAEKLLLSGDSAREGYDEVGTMKRFCLEKGVPEKNILTDTLGVSTFESVSRAKSEFGAEKLIIVTQNYHLYRALYIADRLGITAYGVGADLDNYSGQLWRDTREIPARVKDFLLTL